MRKFTKRIFIITNIAIAVLYLLGCVAPFLNPLKYWWLGVLTVGAPILIVLLLIFFVFWLFVKWRWMAISALALIVGWNTTKVTFGIHFFKGKKQNDENAVKIMTWNVHLFDYYRNSKSPSAKGEMIQSINKENPDIACFQEFVYTQPSFNKQYCMDSFTKTLKMPYYAVISHNVDSIGLMKIKSHYGKAIFSKYPIVNSRKIFFNNKNYNHSFIFADVALPNTTVRVFNIHLQSLYFDEKDYAFVDEMNLDKENIEAESKNILRKMKNGFIKRAIQADTIQKYIQESPYPVIVCGDFNDVPGSYAYFKVRGNLNDGFVQHGWAFGRTFSRISPTLRIDQIFTDTKFNIISYKTIHQKLSDHYPVVAEIVWKK